MATSYHLGMSIVISAPHPRALLFNVPEDVAERLRPAFPTLRPISSIAEVHQPDWDIFITFGGIPSKLSPALHVVSFGDPGSDDYAFVSTKGALRGEAYFHLGGLSKSVALDVIVEDGLPRGVERLARRLAEDQVRSAERVSVVFQLAGVELRPPSSFKRFVSLGDGRAVAGMYHRQRNSGGWSWVISTTTVDAVDWVAAALEHFASIDPERFPFVAWARMEPWITPVEAQLADELGVVSEVRQSLDAREVDLHERYRTAVQRADVGERRLLTGRGDELVSAVVDAFGELGLNVEVLDETAGKSGMEDLRITEDGFPGWVALVEIRPANQGASYDSVRRLYRFAEVFEKTNGQAPSSLWYVASQMVGRDPSTRPTMLAANPLDGKVFGDRGGSAIDTSVLFRLLMDCRRGSVSLTEARRRLRESRGVFSYATGSVPTA